MPGSMLSSRRFAAAWFIIASLLVYPAHPAAAQNASQSVVIRMADGTSLICLLMARTPTGYLVRENGSERLVPYAAVKELKVIPNAVMQHNYPAGNPKQDDLKPEPGGKGLIIAGAVVGAVGLARWQRNGAGRVVLAPDHLSHHRPSSIATPRNGGNSTSSSPPHVPTIAQ